MEITIIKTDKMKTREVGVAIELDEAKFILETDYYSSGTIEMILEAIEDALYETKFILQSRYSFFEFTVSNVEEK